MRLVTPTARLAALALAVPLLASAAATAGVETVTTLSTPTPVVPWHPGGAKLPVTVGLALKNLPKLAIAGPGTFDGGTDFACALTAGGGVACWGANGDGRLGDGTTDARPVPAPVLTADGPLAGVTRVSAGVDHACAVAVGGTVFCWGNGGNGKLGAPGVAQSSVAVPVRVGATAGSPVLTGAVEIAAGGTHTCAVMAAGTVRCWGHNIYGQLGAGDFLPKPAPVAVLGLTDAASVAAGDSHTCVVTSGGKAACWGSNNAGQVGSNSSLANAKSPQMVQLLGTPTLLEGVVRVTGGTEHTCAATAAGAAYCWGRNHRGQLGDGTYFNRDGAVAVLADDEGGGALLADVVALEAGSRHVCAIVAGGAVRCWGSDDAGTLGDGASVPDRPVPAPVVAPLPAVTGGLTGATSLAMGQLFGCAARAVGSPVCWGGVLAAGVNPYPVPRSMLGIAGAGLVKVVSPGPVWQVSSFDQFDWSNGLAIVATLGGPVTAYGGTVRLRAEGYPNSIHLDGSHSPEIVVHVVGAPSDDTFAGGAGGDLLFGGAGDDTIAGNGGADDLSGGEGDDTITGGPGNDVIEGGPGADTLDGGPGRDTLSFAGSTRGVVADLRRRTIAGDRVKNFEDLLGSSFADRLTGNGKANRIAGGAGDDVIEGGGGRDLLTGGKGRDRFVFRRVKDSPASRPDTITDFRAGDVIDLSRFDMNARTRKLERFSVFRGARAFTGKRGELRFVPARSRLEGDVDGDRRADFRVVLKGVKKLKKSAMKLR